MRSKKFLQCACAVGLLVMADDAGRISSLLAVFDGGDLKQL